MVTEDQRNEVTSYLHAQAARLTTDQMLAKRESEGEELLASAAGLSEDEARWAPDGEWNALQILQHVLESGHDYRNRIRRLAGDVDHDEAPAAPESTVPALVRAIRAELARTQDIIRSVADAPTDRVEDSGLFGELNWREWALFERVHVRDHVLQLRALKEGMDTPGR